MLPDRSVLIGQKLAKNAKIEKNQMRHFGRFSNNVRIWRISDYLRSECTKYDFHEFDSIRLYPHENLLIDRQPTK